ncbi:MAG: hypothetical protein QOD42_1012 [Sphingomonadales bacterium]|jgi:hypothetical protein|nr:hypothetical protein [Sphingomonadales bacterium]
MEYWATSKLDTIRRGQDEPGLARHLAAVRADETRRTVRMARPGAVVTSAPSLAKSTTQYWLKPIRGSVMLFWGRQGSELIPALERAYSTGDEAALKKLGKAFADEFERRPVVPIEESFKALFASPMYFDLQYGSKQLISRLALPSGIDFGAVGFAYNGGSLEDEDFTLREYRRPFERLSYETLIVKVPPELSAIEREALELASADASELNIGHAAMCGFGCIAIAAVVIALITCAGGCEILQEKLDEVSLTEDQILQLGPLASAQELLAVRREIFEQHGF